MNGMFYSQKGQRAWKWWKPGAEITVDESPRSRIVEVVSKRDYLQTIPEQSLPAFQVIIPAAGSL